MICKYWTEYDEEYCKLSKKMCMCGAETKYCNYRYLRFPIRTRVINFILRILRKIK
jgi:hypothetical protein